MVDVHFSKALKRLQEFYRETLEVNLVVMPSYEPGLSQELDNFNLIVQIYFRGLEPPAEAPCLDFRASHVR